jgi:large subunit ribosomal protein L15
MKLNDLRDNEGARKERLRIGRGIGSGKGKTGGRGVKGQTSRTGVAINGFEGGQMPIYRRLPKRGFTNIFRLNYAEVNLDRLQQAIDSGKVNPAETINAATLLASGVISTVLDGVRLLGRGTLTSKLTIEVSGATNSAKAAVEKLGGSVVILAPKAGAAETAA